MPRFQRKTAKNLVIPLRGRMTFDRGNVSRNHSHCRLWKQSFPPFLSFTLPKQSKRGSFGPGHLPEALGLYNVLPSANHQSHCRLRPDQLASCSVDGLPGYLLSLSSQAVSGSSGSTPSKRHPNSTSQLTRPQTPGDKDTQRGLELLGSAGLPYHQQASRQSVPPHRRGHPTAKHSNQDFSAMRLILQDNSQNSSGRLTTENHPQEPIETVPLSKPNSSTRPKDGFSTLRDAPSRALLNAGLELQTSLQNQIY